VDESLLRSPKYLSTDMLEVGWKKRMNKEEG
jgi:hypothetical protein